MGTDCLSRKCGYRACGSIDFKLIYFIHNRKYYKILSQCHLHIICHMIVISSYLAHGTFVLLHKGMRSTYKICTLEVLVSFHVETVCKYHWCYALFKNTLHNVSKVFELCATYIRAHMNIWLCNSWTSNVFGYIFWTLKAKNIYFNSQYPCFGELIHSSK